jgi:hypothetical protein
MYGCGVADTEAKRASVSLVLSHPLEMDDTFGGTRKVHLLWLRNFCGGQVAAYHICIRP